MVENMSVEICRVIVVSAHENYPIVGLGQSFGIAFGHVFIIGTVVEAETAVACNDKQGVAHLILYAHLENQLIKISVDVA